MSESKHTPGPWELQESDLFSKVSAKRFGAVATVHGANETCSANARLIAAAPDFLEASEALLIAWEKLAEALPQDDRIEELEFNEFMALRSAVAKARGINSWEIGKHLSGVAKAEGRS